MSDLVCSLVLVFLGDLLAPSQRAKYLRRFDFFAWLLVELWIKCISLQRRCILHGAPGLRVFPVLLACPSASPVWTRRRSVALGFRCAWAPAMCACWMPFPLWGPTNLPDTRPPPCRSTVDMVSPVGHTSLPRASKRLASVFSRKDPASSYSDLVWSRAKLQEIRELSVL